MQLSGRTIPKIRNLVFSAALCCGLSGAYAQVVTPPDTTTIQGNLPAGNVTIEGDTTLANGKGKTGGKASGATSDSLAAKDTLPPTKDNAPVVSPKPKPDFKYHSPTKATWMSAVLPSLGQFYNRRYWKPPIIYAGLGVSIYFLIDNQLKFITARNSYRARVGIEGYTVASKYAGNDAAQIESDREYYRTNRDYCIIAVAGIYALNIIDAAVDAHLRTFDVGDDLSMKVRPSFQLGTGAYQTGFAPTTGIAWTLKF